MAVLFISRGIMSGVRQLVSRFHEKTGIPCLSREDLLDVISRRGEWAVQVVKHLAEATSAYDRFSRSRWHFIVLMRHALLEEIQADHVLYHGFSGHLLLPRLPHFVRIRIDAPCRKRVMIAMENLGCDEAEATEYIRDLDAQRVKWARFMYGRDIRDPDLYDLHINLEPLTLKVACGLLECLVSKKDLEITEASRAWMDRLLVASRIEAALVTDPRTRDLEIRARMEGGRVFLEGPYLGDEGQAVVLKIARESSGIEAVTYLPGYAVVLDVDRPRSSPSDEDRTC